MFKFLEMFRQFFAHISVKFPSDIYTMRNHKHVNKMHSFVAFSIQLTPAKR